MPSHVAGKPDKSHEAADQARLPGVRLILPLQKEEAQLFFHFFCRLSKRRHAEGFNSHALTHQWNNCLFGFGVV